MLINITGSSRLGLHEVNDACELIRKATENDDVQINFGIVLDESMSPVQLAGAALVIVGVLLATVGRRAAKAA